jgi:predicted DNA-binding transcriptional regulator AlpA
MKYLTKVEVAEILHVSIRTVTEYLKLGRLPAASRLGRRLLWSEAAIRACIDASVHQSLAPRAAAPAKLGRPRKFR